MKRKTSEFDEPPAWRVERSVVSLDKIHDYPSNPRTHPPAQVELLAELLKKFGPDQDIVVDEEFVIIKGHGRKAAARLAGLKTFPVTRRFGLSENDKKAMRIHDNQLSLLSGWDPVMIRQEVAALKAVDYPLLELGFGEAQLVQFTTLPLPPSQFQEVDENLPTSCCCPKCHYKWSGDPNAGAKESAPRKRKK